MVEAGGDEAGGRRVHRVSDLLAGLRALFEEQVGRLWVVGEVSNLRQAASGHVYFTLKDDRGQIRAVLFRSAASRVPFELEEGLEVLVYADLGLYEARGDLQLIVRRIEPRGRGALQLAFEQLRRRLEAAGLFDPARKRALPALPRRVGVVTSATSAALRDVIQVTGRRFPSIPLLISPTRVQGEGAEHEIAAALARVATQPGVEVVLLVRGGGSLEDLQAFNSEPVARAIVASPVPVVSGVGHETDLSIADLAADLRAPTPSAAAAAALPDRRALARQLERDWRRLCAAAAGQLRRMRGRLVRERDALRMLAPMARLAAQRRRLAELERRLARSLQLLLQRRSEALARAREQLEALSPLEVLRRGYAIVRRERDGALVRGAQDAAPGERLRIDLQRGVLRAIVAPESADEA